MTADEHRERRVRVDDRTHFTLEDAVLIVAFGKGFTAEDYEAKAQRDCSWQTLATPLSEYRDEVTGDPAQRACLDKLLCTPDRQLFLRLLKHCPRKRQAVTETLTRLLAEAEKQARFASILDRACEAICTAAHHRHIVLSGERASPDESKPPFEIIAPFLFGPSDSRTPILLPPLNEVRMETTPQPLKSLIWTNVQIDRADFERWLEPKTPDPALFDPMQEATWTLSMAVAWLRWKSADAVRQQWNDWRDQCFKRQTHEDGCFLVPWRKASLAVLIEDALENRAAWRDLLQALNDARIVAIGTSTKNGDDGPVICPYCPHYPHLDYGLMRANEL